jgi:hypothetical protein
MKLPESFKPFIDPIIKLCVSQFPRCCPNCGEKFKDFRDFISKSRPIGDLQYLPDEKDEFGLLTYVNCICGSTITLSCSDAKIHSKFSKILEEEIKKTGTSKKELLLALRSAVRERVMSGK